MRAMQTTHSGHEFVSRGHESGRQKIAQTILSLISRATKRVARKQKHTFARTAAKQQKTAHDPSVRTSRWVKHIGGSRVCKTTKNGTSALFPPRISTRMLRRTPSRSRAECMAARHLVLSSFLFSFFHFLIFFFSSLFIFLLFFFMFLLLFLVFFSFCIFRFSFLFFHVSFFVSPFFCSSSSYYYHPHFHLFLVSFSLSLSHFPMCSLFVVGFPFFLFYFYSLFFLEKKDQKQKTRQKGAAHGLRTFGR